MPAGLRWHFLLQDIGQWWPVATSGPLPHSPSTRRSVLELEPRPSALCTLLFLTQITATTSIYINNNYNVQLNLILLMAMDKNNRNTTTAHQRGRGILASFSFSSSSSSGFNSSCSMWLTVFLSVSACVCAQHQNRHSGHVLFIWVQRLNAGHILCKHQCERRLWACDSFQCSMIFLGSHSSSLLLPGPLVGFLKRRLCSCLHEVESFCSWCGSWVSNVIPKIHNTPDILWLSSQNLSSSTPWPAFASSLPPPFDASPAQDFMLLTVSNSDHKLVRRVWSLFPAHSLQVLWANLILSKFAAHPDRRSFPHKNVLPFWNYCNLAPKDVSGDSQCRNQYGFIRMFVYYERRV